MGDLKLYAKNEKDLTVLIETVRIFTTDIRMEFGLEKCARQIIQRGNITITDGLNLDIGKIKDADIETGYKHLGILQNMQNKQKEVKRKVTTTYRKRLRQILKSRLNATKKILAKNTSAMPVITYTAGIIDWNKKEIQDLDRMTRKTMNMYRGLHPTADIHRLYLPRKEGSRGLREVAATVRFQCVGIHQQSKGKRSSYRSSLEISSNQRIQK